MRSTWLLRSTLFLVAAVLVVGGVAIERIDVAAAPASTTTSTTLGAPTTSRPVTTTTLLAPGVVATAPLGGRSPSHCPLTLAPASVRASRTPLVLSPRRCRVLEIGDSLGNDLGWGLLRQLSGYPWLTLVQKDKSSSGLSNAWFYNWPAHLATFLHQYHPNVLIVFLGGNDQQGFYSHGVYESVGTAPWRATYLHDVRQIVDVARDAGAQVLWVGLPVMQPPFYSQGAAMLDSLYVRAIADTPGAAYLPTWHLFATPTGAFMTSARVNGVLEDLRAGDDIHFSEVGENVLSTFVVHEMGLLFHLPLRAAQSAIISQP